jgi:flagellar protein FliO/FliZ
MSASEGSKGFAAQPLDTGALSQMVVGLVVVLALMGAAVWLARHLGSSRWMGNGALKIVAGLPLGSRERVVLIQAEDIKLLVGVAPGRIETLYVFKQPAAMPRTEADSDFGGPFAAALKDGGAR